METISDIWYIVHIELFEMQKYINIYKERSRIVLEFCMDIIRQEYGIFSLHKSQCNIITNFKELIF